MKGVESYVFIGAYGWPTDAALRIGSEFAPRYNRDDDTTCGSLAASISSAIGGTANTLEMVLK
jgi:hypothetical protein